MGCANHDKYESELSLVKKRFGSYDDVAKYLVPI